jgi:hypothetical protein
VPPRPVGRGRQPGHRRRRARPVVGGGRHDGRPGPAGPRRRPGHRGDPAGVQAAIAGRGSPPAAGGARQADGRGARRPGSPRRSPRWRGHHGHPGGGRAQDAGGPGGGAARSRCRPGLGRLILARRAGAGPPEPAGSVLRWDALLRVHGRHEPVSRCYPLEHPTRLRLGNPGTHRSPRVPGPGGRGVHPWTAPPDDRPRRPRGAHRRRAGRPLGGRRADRRRARVRRASRPGVRAGARLPVGHDAEGRPQGGRLRPGDRSRPTGEVEAVRGAGGGGLPPRPDRHPGGAARNPSIAGDRSAA